MAEEVEMTPVEGEIPAKATPFAPAESAAAAPAAPAMGAHTTIRLKPVIRKPMIRKPGTPAPVTPAPAASTPEQLEAVKKATSNLKAVTGPIPAQAVLKKTGIIAEGILTPAQAQAAKSKTSRISLNDAIGVAPTKESAAPMKTIRLRRPTDLRPSAPKIVRPVKPAVPAPAAAPAAPEAVPSTEATTIVKPHEMKPEPVAEMTPIDEMPTVQPESADDASVTQKKTLKLHRPSVALKKPTLGIAKPAVTAVESAPSMSNVPTESGVADMAPVADLGDVPELGPVGFAPVEAPAKAGSGVPTWLAAITTVAAVAALAVIGLVTWQLVDEGCGPIAGANDTAFIRT